MAAMQAQVAAEQRMAAMQAQVNALQRPDAELDILRKQIQAMQAGTQPHSGDRQHPAVVDGKLVPQSADRPAWVEDGMILEAIDNPHRVKPIQQEAYLNGRVKGLLPIKEDYCVGHKEGKAGHKTCEQCREGLLPPSNGKTPVDLEWDDLGKSRPARQPKDLEQHEFLVHFRRCCRRSHMLLKEHCRANPADAWLLVPMKVNIFGKLKADSKARQGA